MLTSHDLMRELEIRHVRTLMRWAEMKLIPEPEMNVHPSGRGRVAYWPDWVLAHGRRIRKMLKDGHTRQQIRKTFGSNWKDLTKTYSRYNFGNDWERNEREKAAMQLAEAIEQQIRLRLVSMQAFFNSGEFFTQSENSIEKARILVQEGNDPVLVLTESGIQILPEVVLAKWIMLFGNSADLLAVYPLRPFFERTHNRYFQPKAGKKTKKMREIALLGVVVTKDFSYNLTKNRTPKSKRSKSTSTSQSPRNRSLMFRNDDP